MSNGTMLALNFATAEDCADFFKIYRGIKQSQRIPVGSLARAELEDVLEHSTLFRHASLQEAFIAGIEVGIASKDGITKASREELFTAWETANRLAEP